MMSRSALVIVAVCLRDSAFWRTGCGDAGEDKWVARSYVAVVLALALLTTKLYVWISYAQRNFSTALSGKDVRELKGMHCAE